MVEVEKKIQITTEIMCLVKDHCGEEDLPRKGKQYIVLQKDTSENKIGRLNKEGMRENDEGWNMGSYN